MSVTRTAGLERPLKLITPPTYKLNQPATRSWLPYLATTMSRSQYTSYPSDPAKVIFFPEGHGFVFISILATTGSSKVVIVKSLKDRELYVRKESEPEAIMQQETIQSREARLNRTLTDIDGIPNLIGWIEYHDEQSSNNFVTATYWELYNRGTLEQLRLRLQARAQSLPEDCLLSIYSQMLKVMMQTFERGVLHTDAHAENWLVDMKNGALPKLGLCDWDMVETKPTEHPRSCTARFCNKSCPVRAWWNSCSENLRTFVLSHVRILAAIGSGPSRLTQRFPYLALFLDTIENHPPSKYRTGEVWFDVTKRTSVWIANSVQETRENNGLNRRPAHDHYDNDFHNLRSTRLPTFDSAMFQAQTMQHDIDEYGLSPRLWRVAHVDEASGRIVALEGQHGRNGYEDYTDPSGPAVEWLDDHLQIRQMVESMEGDLELSEGQGAFQDYDTGFEAYY